MTEDWVCNVWLESCKRNVHASDPEFQAYKCPVFHGLIVTCSNLPRQQKEEIRKLVNDNGEDRREYFNMTLGLEVLKAVNTRASGHLGCDTLYFYGVPNCMVSCLRTPQS